MRLAARHLSAMLDLERSWTAMTSLTRSEPAASWVHRRCGRERAGADRVQHRVGDVARPRRVVRPQDEPKGTWDDRQAIPHHVRRRRLRHAHTPEAARRRRHRRGQRREIRRHEPGCKWPRWRERLRSTSVSSPSARRLECWPIHGSPSRATVHPRLVVRLGPIARSLRRRPDRLCCRAAVMKTAPPLGYLERQGPCFEGRRCAYADVPTPFYCASGAIHPCGGRSGVSAARPATRKGPERA